MGHDTSRVGDDVLALAYIMKKLQMPVVCVNVHLNNVKSDGILCQQNCRPEKPRSS